MTGIDTPVTGYHNPHMVRVLAAAPTVSGRLFMAGSGRAILFSY